MFRLRTIIFLAVCIAVLIGSNIIEVRFHPEHVADGPQRLLATAMDQTLQEQVRVGSIRLFRTVERSFVHDQNHQNELALSHAKDDANRLQQLLSQPNIVPSALVPQAQLFAESLIQLKGHLPQTGVTDTARQTFAAAWQAFTHLQQLEQNQAALHDQLHTLTATIADTLQPFEAPPQVAGAKTTH